MTLHRFLVPTLALAITSIATAATAAETAPATGEADATTESSEEAPKSEVRPGFGARIGGYGFRGEDGKWNDCRMNGLGIFGTVDLTKHIFLELGLDSYSIVNKTDEHMDRVSMLTSVAGGLRMFPDFVITPYIQAGTGAEWTRVTVAGDRTSGVYPIGFLGIGGEINFTDHFKAGAVLRALMMAHPNHEEHDHEIVYQHPPETKMQYEPSSQAQFYLRYVL
jgi:hypothetical protein